MTAKKVQLSLKVYCQTTIDKATCLVPVNNATESYATAFNAPQVFTCGVLNRDGIFYASLRMENSDSPMEIALHGVQSESEAQKAFETLSTLRQARCSPVC